MFSDWQVRVVYERPPTTKRPRLKSDIWIFELGSALDENAARKIWNDLKFTFPETAQIYFESIESFYSGKSE